MILDGLNSAEKAKNVAQKESLFNNLMTGDIFKIYFSVHVCKFG